MILGNRYEADNVADQKNALEKFPLQGEQADSTSGGGGGLWKKPSGDRTEF